MSFDSLDSHRQFAEGHKLNFPLLSDNGELARKYGVQVADNPKGCAADKAAKVCDRYAARTTFVIDKSGKLVRKFSKVRVRGHADEVLQVLRSL